MTVLEVQRILAGLGYRPGPLDGIWGHRTAAAVRAFQRDKGLTVDAIVGPQTRAALIAASGTAPATDRALLPWYSEAVRQYGTAEIPGPASNMEILDWADDLDIAYANDDIPWCGLFVAHCIGSTLQDESLPGNPLGARQWLKFGIETAPTRGSVLVFWRSSPQSWKGHVGFYAGEDNDAYCVLGGNQSDKVSLTWIAKSRLLEARWPDTVAPPADQEIIRLTRGNAQLSLNEA